SLAISIYHIPLSAPSPWPGAPVQNGTAFATWGEIYLSLKKISYEKRNDCPNRPHGIGRCFCPDQTLFGCALSGNLLPSGFLGRLRQNLPEHPDPGDGLHGNGLCGGTGEQDGPTLEGLGHRPRKTIGYQRLEQ